MLNTICQKADAKNQIIDKYCMPKRKHDQNQILRKLKHDRSSISTHRESHEILKKLRRKVNLLQCPSSFSPEF